MNQSKDLLNELQPVEPKPLMSPTWRKILLVACITLVICTIILIGLSYRVYYEDSPKESFLLIMIGAIVGYVLVIPGLALLLSALVSLIPIKGYSYRKRYAAISLIVVVLVEVFLVIMLTVLYLDIRVYKQEHIELRTPK